MISLLQVKVAEHVASSPFLLQNPNVLLTTKTVRCSTSELGLFTRGLVHGWRRGKVCASIYSLYKVMAVQGQPGVSRALARAVTLK